MRLWREPLDDHSSSWHSIHWWFASFRRMKWSKRLPIAWWPAFALNSNSNKSNLSITIIIIIQNALFIERVLFKLFIIKRNKQQSKNANYTQIINATFQWHTMLTQQQQQDEEHILYFFRKRTIFYVDFI